MKTIHLQAVAVWFLLFLTAIVNAAMRAGYLPVVGELAAHQMSTVTGILLFALVMYVWLRWTRASYTHRDLLVIGGLWVSATMVWEFAFGHFVMGHPWSFLLNDYNLLAGRLWTFVLLWTAVGPYIIGKYAVGAGRRGPSPAGSGRDAGATGATGRA